MKLTTPALLGEAWKATLDSIAADGLLKHILYVDLCNEFPRPFDRSGFEHSGDARRIEFWSDLVDANNGRG